ACTETKAPSLRIQLQADQAHVAMEKLRYRRRATCLLAYCFLSTAGFPATYTVSSIPELNARISSAVAGDTIMVRNGVYTNNLPINIARNGTEANPIVIRAETVGGVEIAGVSAFDVISPASYVTIQGFKFTDSGSINIGGGTSHCRFTRNLVELNIPARKNV